MKKTTIFSPSDTTEISVDYLSFQADKGIKVPENVFIQIKTPRNRIYVRLEYEKIEINELQELIIVIPENYEKYPDAFKFIRDVAVDWTDSRYLEAEPGDYITVVRQAKGTGDWFLGAITDEQARKTTIKFDFLEPGTRYMAEMYVDAPDAHWEKNPQAYRVGSQVVTQKSVLNLTLAAGGGTAIRFRKL